MRYIILLVACITRTVAGYGFVGNLADVDSSILHRDLSNRQAAAAASCPFNPKHTPAIPISTEFPYCGAKGGIPGKQSCPNNKGPAVNDTAHGFFAPDPKTDIRGPCPGLNTAANHNFLSHDGITNFTELVDMQQNVYGVGYDLAVLLATLGIVNDGDPVTERLSIGCDATNRTAFPGLGPEAGLNGHNSFEHDSSLTRNDYFLANGDNFSFNRTLFDLMNRTVNGNFSRDQMALYRALRYNQSRADNPNFYFGPKAILLYGAAAFVYELFPSLGDKGPANLALEEFLFAKEQLPPTSWFSRATPFTIPLLAEEIVALYSKYPVEFGGNAGKGNFIGIGGGGASFFNNGRFNGTSQDTICLLYQLATENQPSGLGSITNLPISTLLWAASKLNPIYKGNNWPCPLRL